MAKSSKKSSAKKNAKRVVDAAGKYSSKNSKKKNVEVVGGVAKAAAESAASSRNKKHKKFYTFLCVIAIIAVVALTVYGYYNGWFDTILNPNHPPVTTDGEISFHFLELGNQYTGDSVYVKAGDTDILIDAGSRKGSAETIGNYVDQYCTDGVLEYVIATHAHQDHIAGFVGTASAMGIFQRYECKNIIEFARSEAKTQIYKDYQSARDAEVAAGANCYTAMDCINNANGAQKIYDLTGDGSITMEVLYQKYYEQKSGSGGENDYSVCLLFAQGENNYLFTGDLEKDGEASLVEENPNLPEVVLFKGGHHGSYTASSDVLLSKIKPQYVCVCCCAGSTEYASNPNHTFPAQEFVDRIANYTDNVYVTTMVGETDNDFMSMNGNIVFKCTNGTISLNCSNNNTKLKDTDWFKNNRTCPDAWKKSDAE